MTNYEVQCGKHETEEIFLNDLSLKIDNGEKGPLYSLTYKQTGQTTVFTSAEICKPQILKARLFEISEHMSPCSGPELALLVTALLKKERRDSGKSKTRQ